MKKILALDTFRFILALCVLFGHTYIVLYRQGKTLIGMQNLAVDGFFILSGFLLALSIAKNLELNKDFLFQKQIQKRIKRLWPEYFFALVLVIFLSSFFKNINWLDIPLNLIFISQINKVSGILNGSWYVCVLFWVGSFLSAMLVYKKNISILVTIPLLLFLIFSYIYSNIGHLSIHGSNHLIVNAWSLSLLKGFMDIGLGIELFYLTRFFQNNSINIKSYIITPILFLLEIFGICLFVYAMSSGGPSKKDFIVILGYIFLIPILYLQKEHLLKFLSFSLWKMITPTSYMLYLSHVIWLDIIKKYIPYKEYPQPLVYLIVMVFCITFAFICYHAQKWLFAKLKDILFISNQQTPAPNIAGDK